MRSKVYCLILFLVSQFFNSGLLSQQSAPSAPLDDLKALVKERDWGRAADQSLLVPPSQRQEQWKTLAQKSWKAYASLWLERPLYLPVHQNRWKQFLDFKALRDDRVSTELVLTMGLRFISQCWGQAPLQKEFNNFESCVQDFFLLWHEARSYPTILIELWQLIESTAKTIQDGISRLQSDLALKESQRYLLALAAPKNQWFLRAIELAQELMLAPGTDKICGQEPFIPWQWEVLKQFILKLTQPQREQFPVLIAKKMSWRCWERTRNYYLEHFEQYIGDDRQLLLYLLGADQSLDLMTQRYLLLLYLVEKPRPSAQLNLAWKSMEELGSNIIERQTLIEKIKGWKYWPDQFLIDQNQTRRDAIVELLLINFPEWWNTYEDRCLNYLQSPKDFSQGNPTAQCKIYCGILKNKPTWQIRSARYIELKKILQQLCVAN